LHRASTAAATLTRAAPALPHIDKKGVGEIAAAKRRYGYRRIHVLLRRKGWDVNRKKTYRLYREMGLAVRRRKRKRIGPFERAPLPKPSATNQSWSMDFIADGCRWSAVAVPRDRRRLQP
jgi:transposase InsO family protein